MILKSKVIKLRQIDENVETGLEKEWKLIKKNAKEMWKDDEILEIVVKEIYAIWIFRWKSRKYEVKEYKWKIMSMNLIFSTMR